ncbi:hypothetical protein D3C80_1584940 [compost metagenome]
MRVTGGVQVQVHRVFDQDLDLLSSSQRRHVTVVAGSCFGFSRSSDTVVLNAGQTDLCFGHLVRVVQVSQVSWQT